MTHAELLTLEDDQPDLVKAITSAAKFRGYIELQLDKLELGQVARKMGVETSRAGSYMWQNFTRYNLRFSYMEMDVCLYSIVPNQ